jgi:hypothetical protein
MSHLRVLGTRRQRRSRCRPVRRRRPGEGGLAVRSPARESRRRTAGTRRLRDRRLRGVGAAGPGAPGRWVPDRAGQRGRRAAHGPPRGGRPPGGGHRQVTGQGRRGRSVASRHPCRGGLRLGRPAAGVVPGARWFSDRRRISRGRAAPAATAPATRRLDRGGDPGRGRGASAAFSGRFPAADAPHRVYRSPCRFRSASGAPVELAADPGTARGRAQPASSDSRIIPVGASASAGR